MTEQLITFDTAVLAKEKGFDGFSCCDDKWLVNEKIGLFKEWRGLSPYIADGCGTVYRPLQSLLQKWLRDVKNKDIEISTAGIGGHYYCFVHGMKHGYIYDGFNIKAFPSYEEALEAGLLEALKLVTF